MRNATAGNRIEEHGLHIWLGFYYNAFVANLTPAQWDIVAASLQRTGAFPLVDLAYLGFGDGIEADAYGVRKVASSLPECLIAFSASKNFGLYRERAGVAIAMTRPASDLVMDVPAGFGGGGDQGGDERVVVAGVSLAVVVERRDFQLTPLFQSLLAEPALQVGTLRALALYDVPTTPPAIFAVYASFGPEARRAALACLASRPAYARELLEKFASRAYRRPVEPATLDRLVALAEGIYSQPKSHFEAGVAQGCGDPPRRGPRCRDVRPPGCRLAAARWASSIMPPESMTSRTGCAASARATAARCCSPPES